jgi:hypothetical protein
MVADLCYDVRQAAEAGDAYAQACMAFTTTHDEKFLWAERSAQGERDGFYWPGQCYSERSGCGLDFEKARENSLLAAELEHVGGYLFDATDPQRFFWLAKAAVVSGPMWFFAHMEMHMDKAPARVVFEIGCCLKGQIDSVNRTICGSDYNFDHCIGYANNALLLYNFQLQAYRRAVDCWTGVCLRNNIVKDIRKMMGKMIWDARKEAQYAVIDLR